MYYKVVNDRTGVVVASHLMSRYDAKEVMRYEDDDDLRIEQVSVCRCGNDSDTAPVEERYDAYGISTGIWCDPCYDSSAYPYRKDGYETIETHGYGERLNDDY